MTADPRIAHTVRTLAEVATTSAMSVTEFVSSNSRPLDRCGGPAHVTASCVVFSPDFTRVLLTHHAKGRFWVQFGGHVEPGDATVRDAALREAREESGVQDFPWLSPHPVDVHSHDLPGAFGACATHHDVVYGAVLSPDAHTQVSDESLDVKWFPIDDLPGTIVDDLPQRLPGLIEATRSQYLG